ncbi:MAG TPA: WG repeat-containing protein, partial [Thermoanaerobaculia bacterium]|nr:WG repeat-containing protein [Thermoanaerobaculia bacterium]
MTHRSSRRRTVVLAASFVVASCGRESTMPPAKVRLDGYQLKTSFSEGLAVIQRSDDLELGFVDSKGTVAIPPRFQDAGRFSEGLAAAREEYRAGF